MANATTPVIQINEGNVGIGTTSPESLLHIKGETRAYISFQDTTDGYFGFVGDAANMLTSGTVDNLGLRGEAGIQFGVSDVIKMVLDSSGNLGIGTDSPGKKLEVAGSYKLGTNAYIQYDAGYPYTISILNTAGVGNLIFNAGAGSSGFESKIELQGSNTVGAAGITLSTGSSSRIVVTADGNVGIGTTSPSMNFQVKNNFFEHALGKSHTGIGDLFSIQFGTSGQANKGSIIVTIFGSRFSPGQNDYAGGAVYYLTRSNVGTITTVTASTTGTWQPVIDTNNTTKIWTLTSASPLGGSAGNFTTYSVTIQGIGHNGYTVINPTVTIL